MLSQTTEYALRAMACLAYSPDDLTPTPKLAELTMVPPNYLAKVLQSLAQADLISGRRGVGGGYRLARTAEEISLLDVVNAIDPVERIHTCPLGLANHGSNLCALHKCVDAAAQQFITSFKNVRLSDLIAESNGSVPLCDTEMVRMLSLRVEGVPQGEGGRGLVSTPEEPGKPGIG